LARHEQPHVVQQLVVPPEHLARPRNRPAVLWAEAKGYWSSPATDGTRTLQIPAQDWDALASGPGSDDPEVIEQWCYDHEALSRLAHVGAETLAVRCTGYIGGRSVRLSLEVLEHGEVDLKASSPGRYVLIRQQRIVLSPLASAIADRVIAFAEEDQHEESAQLRVVAALKRLRELSKKLGEDTSRLRVHLDSHLDSFQLIEPKRVRPRWIEEGPNRISLKVFLDDEAEPVSLDTVSNDGALIARPAQGQGPARERVLLDPASAAVMQRAREYNGVRTARVDPEVLANPLAIVPEGLDAPQLDFSDYGHRVVGFAPVSPASSAGEASGVVWYRTDSDSPEPYSLSLRCDTGSVSLSYDSLAEVAADVATLETARQNGEVIANIRGLQVCADETNIELARSAVSEWRSASHDDVGIKNRVAGPLNQERAARRLQAILADIDAAGPDSNIAGATNAVPWHLLQPLLKAGVELKPHQRTGIAWLWHRYQAGEAGGLLADDMGLGKTLQIACFIALCLQAPRTPKQRGPNLIVAPVVLVANWERELTHFFVGPFPGRMKALTSENVKGLCVAGALDATLLKTFDVVITTYDVLARHQTSLLKMTWSVVVLDEAHKIKNRGTQWSRAARGLSGLESGDRPRKFTFGICATGTPIENTVNDLWALYDFLAPGLFGSFEHFVSTFGSHEQPGLKLAAHLRVGASDSSLLRRDKKQLDLPPKVQRVIPVAMTASQRDLERTIIRRERQAGPLGVLQRLQQLYQHPWLLEPDERELEASVSEALRASPKLEACIEILREVQRRNERALVFTLWTRMQFLLKAVIEHELGTRNIPIVNGEPSNARRAQEHIDNLTAEPGFGVMILSPLAAGTGLNIVAANHVIHYGRWWNPAKEDQATDRAYRIGQTRPVTVYYPVLHHPDDRHEGFDVKLDELVARKRSTARDLFDPQDTADITSADLSELGGSDV
jgi:hypothetical protein